MLGEREQVFVFAPVFIYNQDVGWMNTSKYQEGYKMIEPIDGIFVFHNACRRDMTRIDEAALGTVRGKPGLAAEVDRYRFYNEILVWHAHGEELAIFPALDAVVPLVAEAYLRDHHFLDVAYDRLNAAVLVQDPLETSRATAAFKYHLDVHLEKEEAHLYRLVKERIPVAERGKLVGLLSTTIPQDRFPEVIAWLYPLINSEDRENMIRIWQMLMPPQVFAGIKPLIEKAVGDDWAELTRRIPTLG
jgi:hypothetical protein